VYWQHVKYTWRNNVHGIVQLLLVVEHWINNNVQCMMELLPVVECSLHSMRVRRTECPGDCLKNLIAWLIVTHINSTGKLHNSVNANHTACRTLQATLVLSPLRHTNSKRRWFILLLLAHTKQHHTAKLLQAAILMHVQWSLMTTRM